jgi:signal transduction histidine kinase
MIYQSTSLTYWLKFCFLLSQILWLSSTSFAISTVSFLDKDNLLEIGSSSEILEDKDNVLTIEAVMHSDKFKKINRRIPNLGLTNSSFWIKFQLTNLTDESHLLIELAEPTVDEVTLYRIFLDSSYAETKISENEVFSSRKYFDPNYLFDINIPKGETRTFFIKVISKQQIQLPLFVGTQLTILHSIKFKDIFSGMYFGLMLIMIFYNLFIYITVRDKSYFFYVVYIAVMLLTQASSQGYTFQLLWPNNTWMAIHSLFLFPAIAGMTFIEFTKVFLEMRKNLPKMWRGTFIIQFFYLIGIVTTLTSYHIFGYKLIELTAGFISIYMLIAAALLSRKYRPARFYLIAWTIFLAGVIVFVLKDFEVLPYNNFTRYGMQIGSAIETVLLSFALADRINILRKEKEVAQANELKERLEKQQILEQQNSRLEREVSGATQELRKKNTVLNTMNSKLEQTLKALKEAQLKLVQTEKMSAVVQLSAGMAHEINNAMHITRQSHDSIEKGIKDLNTLNKHYQEINWDAIDLKKQLQSHRNLSKEMDLDYLLVELADMLKTASFGVNKTVGICNQLASYSQINQEEFRPISLKENMNALLKLVEFSLIGEIRIDKDFEGLPMINCYGRALNLTFQNVLKNAVQAIHEKGIPENEGIIKISIRQVENMVVIKFTDNGVGMNKETKSRAFDLFYTSKEIGQGRGLGLADAYSTLKNHDGFIEIESEIGKGSVVSLIFPIK